MTYSLLSLRGLAVLLLASVPALAQAAVRPVPSAAYPTIQSGIDAASNGDIVLVADGTFSGPGNRDIDFHGKSLIVMSQNGPAKTIIDCGGHKSKDGSGSHRGFYVHSGEKKAIISGFTVKNGYEMPSADALAEARTPGDLREKEVGYFGGGVVFAAGGGSTLLLTHCIVCRNAASASGGIDNQSNGGTITLADCSVFGNAAEEGGGGISNGTAGGGKITLLNCVVFGNTADLGGGIVNENDADSSGKIKSGGITFVNCTITENNAEEDGCGSGVFNYDGKSTAAFINCILFDDKGDEIRNSDNTTEVNASYSDIQDGCPGKGNISAKPRFINAAAGNFHLQPCSPCLGKGTAHGAPAADRNGKTRPNPPSMGAFE